MSKYRNNQKKIQIPPESEVEDLAQIFKALSNPHRLQIYLRLSSICSPNAAKSEFETRSCIGQAGKGLDIVASTLSHHIKELKQAGLLNIEKSGQERKCGVDKKTLEKLKSFFIKLG